MLISMPTFRRAHGFKSLLALVVLAFGPGAAAAPTVVASIAPVHSLVAAVMQGVGVPRLLVPGGSSPHAHALRPSDARAIESATLLVWVGPGLENFLARPITSLVREGEVLRLADTEGLHLLPLRDDHDHEHGHAGNRRQGDGHGNQQEPGGDAHVAAAGTGIDMHVWLDPANAQRMVASIGAALARIDPANAASYADNAAVLRERIAALDERIADELAPLAGRRFVVFHDGFQYFEKRYGLASAGVLTVNPEVPPGAERVRRLRSRIATTGIGCVFVEPQFPIAIAETLVEGSGARIGRIDPLGADLAPGAELYPRLLEAMAGSFRDCLAPVALPGRRD